MQRKYYAAGNWKMHGVTDALNQLVRTGTSARQLPGIVTLICLPATLISQANGHAVLLGGQDCHAEPNGAHTGDISAQMLADAGAEFVIVGHSERRADHGESDAMVAAKAEAAWKAGLVAIICIGETEAQYRAGQTLDVVRAQLAGSVPAGASPANTIIAYEPIWAIGTGLTPTTQEIATTHGAVRAALPDPNLSVLYGGSVKPSNAAEIFALDDVDGGLVGGASLTADDFIPIMDTLAKQKGPQK